jgi:hypothetical protein
MDLSKNKHWFGIRRETGEEDRRRPGIGRVWRKQGSATKRGVRLRSWPATESDGDASEMPYIPNGTKGSTTTTTTTVVTDDTFSPVVTIPTLYRKICLLLEMIRSIK